MTSSKHWSYRREVKQERRQRRDAERAEAERGYAIDARGKSERSRRKASPAGAVFTLSDRVALADRPNDSFSFTRTGRLLPTLGGAL